MIVVDKLTKIYGNDHSRFVALDEVSLSIASGSTAAIVGKSGSGKSTLMHVMSGLDRPTSGTVRIDKNDMFSMQPLAMDAFRATQMSFIFQAFFVEANQTCYQNVMLPLEIGRIGRSECRKLVMDALKAVDLEEKSESPAVNLSGGQKQRLAIARAIVNKPRILFADEPTGNLDSATGEKIMQLLFKLNKELGCTLILVTHDEELAARCQQQIYIKDGSIEKVTNQANVHKSIKPKPPLRRVI